MQRTLAWHPATLYTAFRRNQTWRIEAKPGSRLRPRDRRERDTVFSPPFPEMVKPGERPEDIVGIKQLVNDADLVIEPEKERILLDGPLPGSFRLFSFHESVDVYVAQNDAGQSNTAQTYLYDRDAQAESNAAASFTDEIPEDDPSKAVVEKLQSDVQFLRHLVSLDSPLCFSH